MEIKDDINRFAAGNFTKNEKELLGELFCDAKNLTDLQTAMRKEWEMQKDDSNKELDHILNKIHFQINTREAREIKSNSPRRKVLRWIIELCAAAVISIGVITAYVVSNAQNGEVEAYAQIEAPLNARVQFCLPDGTVGWLNSGATLKYPVSFNSDRQVQLHGEGFFDVTKSSDGVPFTVLANDAKIVVWGTRFDVIAHEEGNIAEVVLEEGKVEFCYSSKVKNKSVMMKPGDKLVYDNRKQTHKVVQTNPSDHLQWINGRFVIRGESITSFASQFGRRFNMEVVVADKQLDNIRFRATFENESPEEILRLLDLITPISYTVQDRMPLGNGTFSKKKVTINYSHKQLKNNKGIYE